MCYQKIPNIALTSLNSNVRNNGIIKELHMHKILGSEAYRNALSIKTSQSNSNINKFLLLITTSTILSAVPKLKDPYITAKASA